MALDSREVRLLALKIGDLIIEKNESYGNSFGVSGEILRVLYPNGVRPDQYDDLMAVTRIVDKLFRVATSPEAFDEEPFKDIAGYGLLGVLRNQKRKKEKKERVDALKEARASFARHDLDFRLSQISQIEEEEDLFIPASAPVAEDRAEDRAEPFE